MSFAQYLRVFLQKSQPVFEAETPQVEEAPATQAFDFESVEKKINAKIGGNPKESTDRKTSFEALEQILDDIGLDYLENPQNPNLDKIVELLSAKDRFDFLAEYINEKTGVAKSIISEIENIVAIKDSDKYVSLTESFMRVSERLLKLRILLVGQLSQAASTPTAEPAEEPKTDGVSTVYDKLVDSRVEIDWDSVEYDPSSPGNKKKTSGTSNMIDFAGRKIVVINVEGRHLPFYLSTGGGKKVDVAAGKWYPIFGISESGWLNKLSGKEINDYYGSEILRGISQSLDKKIGDVRNDDSIPKVGVKGRHFDVINKDLNPTENELPTTRDAVEKNIKETVDFLNGVKLEAATSEAKRLLNFRKALLESANIDDETREKLKKLLEELENTLKECTSRFNANTTNSINAIPNSPEGEDSLNKYKDLLVLMGLIELFKKVLNNKDKEIKKDKPVETNDDVLRRKKRRLVDRLIRAIQYAKLPSISNNAITAQGDHFRLFKKLEEKNKSWMEDSLKNYVFNNNPQQYSEFGQAGQTAESPLEKDQIAYLRANNSWIRSYIESKETFLVVNQQTGETATVEFTQKEADQLITKLVAVVTEKEKEIKNYYLSRDFNLGNFSGVQLTPEIRLPLNQKVKLPVTDEDRKKESPLRNLFSGMGKILTGLFSAIPDTGNEQVAKQARERNLAIMNGLNLILRGTVALFGGKQAGRDYDKNVTSKLPGADNKSVKEDMLSMSDSPGAMVVNPEAPGLAMQVPASMPKNNMDTFALAGPLKKKPVAKKAKPKTKAKPALQKVSTRVSSFQDFMKRK